MKKLVILCLKDDKIGTELVRGLLSKLKEANFVKQYTTDKNANENFESVSNRVFFDMVEENKFLDYHDENGVFYGTLYDRSEKGEGVVIMLNSVDVALEIKKDNTRAMTFYVLPESEREEFEKSKFQWSDKRTKNKLLDFLVTYDTVEQATETVCEIVNFMSKHAIFSSMII